MFVKKRGAVIQDESSDTTKHDEAVDGFEYAMDELAELGVHVNNEGDFPVFSLGVKETAYDPSALVAGAPFLRLPSAVELSSLTAVADLSKYRTFNRSSTSWESARYFLLWWLAITSQVSG